MPVQSFIIPGTNSSTTPERFPSFIADFMQRTLGKLSPPPPLANMPCANARPAAPEDVCKKEGSSVCGGCRLVAYCSPECQTAHWKDHKKDCKHQLRSEKWKPGWVVQNRAPVFNDKQSRGDELDGGSTLWGDTPAVDLLNIAGNEKDDNRDYSVAIAASGDLRDVIKTVNGLPEDYGGQLTVVLNDTNHAVVARNIMLLLILANQADATTLSADMALHYWYSVAVPKDYQLKIMGANMPWGFHTKQSHLSNEYVPFRIGERSELHLQASQDEYKSIKSHFERWIGASHDSKFSGKVAQGVYRHARDAPSRQDDRDKMYYNLRPSHRVAVRKYRDSGIVLPHGAVNTHFDTPNLSLFTREGKWMQPDYADPLEGWSISDILGARKRHGGTSEDVYGCLYFFLSEQLNEFAKRIRKFRISFKLFPCSSRALATSIREGLREQSSRLPATVRFDRIAVSNILDEDYEGVETVLTEWAPLLSRGPHASIVGYFVDWVLTQPDGRVRGAGKEEVDKAMLEKRKALKLGLPNSADPGAMATQRYCSFGNIDAFYDNSKPFANYLRQQGLDALMERLKLKLKEKHTVFPHRLGVPLEATFDAMPDVAKEDKWYHQLELVNRTWSERYVEFAPN